MRSSRAFENAVEKAVAAAAWKVLKDEQWGDRGFFRGRENALRWFMEDEPRLERYARRLKRFIARDNGAMNEMLKSEAISRLQGLSRPPSLRYAIFAPAFCIVVLTLIWYVCHAVKKRN